jgi:hypothetical protein
MLTDEHVAVNAMIADGVPFERIERYINALALPSEQLGALWLLAWAESTDAATRQQVVAEALGFTLRPDAFDGGGARLRLVRARP